MGIGSAAGSLFGMAGAVVASVFASPKKQSIILTAKGDLKKRKRVAITPTDAAPNQGAVVAPVFKMVFLTVVAIITLTGSAHVYMAYTWPEAQGTQLAAFEAMGFAWKAGVGAIFGLLGGKVT